MLMTNRVKHTGLVSALTGLTLLLGACANNATPLADTSSSFEKPYLVASNISVDVVPYSGAQTPKGAATKRKDISGHVLMPVGTFLKYESDMARAEQAIARATAAVQQATNTGLVFETYARACREDRVCNQVAAARVQSQLKSVKAQ